MILTLFTQQVRVVIDRTVQKNFLHVKSNSYRNCSLTTFVSKLVLLYCIMSTDNGQHFGDHRIPAGKRQAFESDVLVPFFIRGPGIAQGSSSSQVVQSVDLGPTFLDLASSQKSSSKILKSNYPMDGKSILPLLTSNPSINAGYNNFRWAALLEMYGGSSTIGKRYKKTEGYYRNHMVRNGH